MSHYQKEKKDITAQNQWTASIYIKSPGQVIIEDTGSISATITLQVSGDDGVTWTTVKTWTAETAEFLQHGARQLYRLGVATGDFTSGTATVYLIDSGDSNN